MAASRALALAVLVLVALSAANAAHQPSGGHRNGVAFADAGYYFVTNGNGSWSAGVSSIPVALASAYIGNSVFQALGGAYDYFPTLRTATGGAYFGRAAIAAVTFPSKTLGVAVGPAPTTALSTQTAPLTSVLGPAATFTPTYTTPNILITLDGGDHWLAVANTFPLGVQAGSVPDLTSVWCASKLLCWAVGHVYNAVTAEAASPSSGNSVAVLVSMSGGTTWTYTVCPDALVATTSSPSLPCSAGTKLPTASPAVVALWSVSSDSSGMHVYAVGSLAWNTNTGSITPGAILYSGNGGVAWTQQAAPVFQGVGEYSLLGVSVATGKVAVAVGGQTRMTSQIASNYYAPAYSNGVVLLTTNGGFSWLPQNLVSNVTGKATGPLPMFGTAGQSPLTSNYYAPLLTGVYFNRNKNVNSSIWVVGVSPYNTLAGAQAGLAAAASAADYLPCYSIFSATLPAGLASLNTTLTFKLLPQTALPNSYAQINACGNDLLGTVWDNAQHGWIYGLNTILVTHNGGATWTFETPQQLLLNANQASAGPYKISTMGNVPSAY